MKNLAPWIRLAVLASQGHAAQVLETVAGAQWSVASDLAGVFAALPTADMTELQRQVLLAGRLAGMDQINRKIAVSGQRSAVSRANHRLETDATQIANARAIPDAQIAFETLPFVEAIKAFEIRLGLNPDDFLRLDAEARSRAFRVAGVYNMQLLATIHAELVASIQRGEAQRDFRLSLPQLAERDGWVGENPWHANVVQFQNVAMASNAGRFEQMQRADVGHWRFVVNGDSCPICLPQMNKVFTLADRKYYPPLHFNCDCDPEPVFEDSVGDVVRSDAIDNPALHEYQQADSAFAWDPAHYAKLEPLALRGYPTDLQPTFKAFAKQYGWEITS